MYSFEAIKSESPYYQEVVLYYKVNPCPNASFHKLQKPKGLIQPCNQHPCFNHHDQEERRRPVFDEETHSLLYNPMWCDQIKENGVCVIGDECSFAHTENEVNYHPLYYKTEPCVTCEFANTPKLCPQYHSDEANRALILEKFRTKESREHSNNAHFGDVLLPKGFSLDNFKTKPCTVKGNHNPKVCDHYHFDKDRRRPTNIFNYSTVMCSYAARNLECPEGDNCGYCHNKVEELYHPERYKRKFCLCHPHNVHKCEYGNYCSFAHNEGEIKIELLHNMKKDEKFYLYKYKTVFCPYIYSHDRNQCVYAHNPQDYRRDPRVYNYKPMKCTQWAHGSIYSYEEGGCPKLMDCEFCHGWKELEYHPLYYKTQICSNANKNCIKVDCPFLHPNRDCQEKTQHSQPRKLSMETMRNFAFVSPQKQSSFGPDSETKPNFYSHFKTKGERRNDSNFQGPIIPIRNNHKFKDESKEDELRPGTLGSTRPNSNVSSMYYTEEEIPKKPNKKKKKKQMSLQDKNEDIKSPLSVNSDIPMKGGSGPKRISSPQINFWGGQAPGSEEKSEDPYEIRRTTGKLSGNRTNDSFESLQSYTMERQNTPTEKAKVFNEQFKKELINSLKRKGLDYVIPILISPRADIEGLKTFSQRDFNMFPQIRFEDKEKIVTIIQRIIEEENQGISQNVLTSPFEMMIGENQLGGNLDFLDNQTNLKFTKHPFN